MSCPTCGGVVEDHRCTACGAAVWPEGGAARRPIFVNPPEAAVPSTPPPPASAAQPDVPPPPPPPPPPPVAPAASGWQPSSVPPPSAGTTSRSSSRVLWWILGGAGALAVLGVLAVVMLLRSADLGLGDLDRVGTGSAERLGILYDGCDAGDMQACDDLYLESPVGSPEEEFGDTCGNRNDPSGWCVDVYGPTTSAN